MLTDGVDNDAVVDEETIEGAKKPINMFRLSQAGN
jgi:hypothetical protein